jgi:glycosyltransferase involved in cell wall biosynthesis
MLGVVLLQTKRPLEALKLILQAGELTGWRLVSIQHNLGLAMHDVLANDADTYGLRLSYWTWCQQKAAQKVQRQPLVSIVIPSYNHRAYIVDCIGSVFSQTYRHIELIVIDDGSSDGSQELIERTLADCPFPSRLISREHRGAHATINEGLTFATGEFANILNSDDLFTPDRIERMVDEVVCTGAEWGFANVQIINGAGIAVANAKPGTKAGELQKMLDAGPRAETIGFGLLRSNFAISSGNLFFSRALIRRLGGFSNLRYNHDWDFVLKATRESEPVYLPDKLYLYRLHDHNTISESTLAPKQEAATMFRQYLAESSLAYANPFAPCRPNWGRHFLAEQCVISADWDFEESSAIDLARQLVSDELPDFSAPPVSNLTSFVHTLG